jgi:hypothetical protein
MGHFAFVSVIVAFLLSSLLPSLPSGLLMQAGAINPDCPPLTIQSPPPVRFPPLQASGHIAYANQGLHLLSLKDDITLTLHSTVPWVGHGTDGKLAWSPNARWIAFHYYESAYHCDQGYLLLADLATGRAYRVTHAARELSVPAWSPDSRWVSVADREGVLIGALIFTTTAYATSYTSKKFTAYAMGSMTGANGSVQIVRGDFTNHPPSCTGDPARNWAWGTQISSISPSVAMIMSNNGTQYYTSLYLYDNGDPSCSQPAYWVDVYFGRSIPNSQTACSCPGVSNSVCYVEQTNSCTNATNFGASYRNYVGP